MSIIFSENESLFFVGGRGTKAGNNDAGGGCTKDYWGDLWSPNKLLSDVMGTNGEPISDSTTWGGSQAACTISDNGSGLTRITKAGCFGSCEVGHIANIEIAGPGIDDGRYEVILVTADYIDIDKMIGGATCDVNVGGALADMQTALDNTTAEWPLTPFNVFILTNKDETFASTADQIDVDFGGGYASKSTIKNIVGIDDDGVELTKGSWTEFDGAGYACHIFRIYNLENIVMRHIYAKDSHNSYYGFYITATGYQQGFLLKDCKSTDCRYGVYTDTYYVRGVTISGGYYSSNSGTCIAVSSSRWVNIFDVVFEGNNTAPLIEGDVVGTLFVDGCFFYKTAGYALGIRGDSWDVFIVVRNCVFYDIDYCIQIADPESRLYEENNIYILHTASTGKYFNVSSGTVIYSNYSCGWSVDGTPPSMSGRWGGVGIGEHSIEQDPLFFDAANQDFRIKMTSPCKRTGNPTLGKI